MRGIHLGGALVTALAGAWAVGALVRAQDGWGDGAPAAATYAIARPRFASGARFFGATPEMINQVTSGAPGRPSLRSDGRRILRPFDRSLAQPGDYALVDSVVARRVPRSQVRECGAGEPDRFYEFYFTRAIYSEYGGNGNRGRGFRGGGDWAMDYPKADCQFITVVKRLAGVDMFGDSNATRLDDPRVRNFPFLYALEVGRNGGMNLSDTEVDGLRNYLAAGGFLVIDDFWGTEEWYAFEREIARVLPGKEIVEIPMDHTIFRIFYNIEEVIQVPISGNAEAIALGYPGAVTYERDGYEPHVRGIFDDQGRPMVIINWNTDLGDAWEYAESPYYPLNFSTFAFQMGVNMILYAMTH